MSLSTAALWVHGVLSPGAEWQGREADHKVKSKRRCTYPPNIPSRHTQEQVYLLPLHLFLFISFFPFFLYLGYCSFFAGIMAQEGNTHWTIRASVFPCNSPYLILHKSHENFLLLSISEQYFLTNDDARQERPELSLHILSLCSCKGCELFTKTLTSSEKSTNNNHKIQGASVSELSTIP